MCFCGMRYLAIGASDCRFFVIARSEAAWQSLRQGAASIADFWKIRATVPGDCHVGPLGLLAMTCVLQGCTVRTIPSAIKMRNDHCRTVHVLKTPGAVSLGGWKIGKICRKGLDKRTQIWYYGTP